MLFRVALHDCSLLKRVQSPREGFWCVDVEDQGPRIETWKKYDATPPFAGTAITASATAEKRSYATSVPFKAGFLSLGGFCYPSEI
jgi:hypothetical protein